MQVDSLARVLKDSLHALRYTVQGIELIPRIEKFITSSTAIDLPNGSLLVGDCIYPQDSAFVKRPIHTAPTDGTYITLYDKTGTVWRAVYWGDHDLLPNVKTWLYYHEVHEADYPVDAEIIHWSYGHRQPVSNDSKYTC